MHLTQYEALCWAMKTNDEGVRVHASYVHEGSMGPRESTVKKIPARRKVPQKASMSPRERNHVGANLESHKNKRGTRV